MTQSLTARDRFLTGLQANLHDAIASGKPRFTLPYEGKANVVMNTVNMQIALRRALNAGAIETAAPTAFVVPPSQVSRTREILRGKSVRVFSGGESAFYSTMEQIKEEDCSAIVLWRLFPQQQKKALKMLNESLPNRFTIVVEDETLKMTVPASDTRTVMPENRITPEKAARMRARLPYRLFNSYTGEEVQKEPELVDASASRAHCRLCGTIIQPRTTCVRYYQFTGPSRARNPNAMYLHNFDCKQPGQILMIDTIKGYAVITNEHGDPTEVKLLEQKYDPETGQIMHKTVDIHRPIG